MGLSIAISGVIVLTGLMYVLLNVPTLLVPIFSVEDAASEVYLLEESLLQTDISLDTLSASAGSPTVDFTLNNDGTEKLWKFEKFTVIITYDASTDRVVEVLSYDGICPVPPPPAGSWCIETFTGDVFEPGVLNNGESANIRTQVGQNLASGIVVALVTSDNGAVTTLATTT